MRFLSLFVLINSYVFVKCVPFPLTDSNLDFELEQTDDTQVVQSLIREVRAAPEHVQELVGPDTEKAFLHKYSDNDSDGDDNGQGYHKRSQDEGAKGYKHFDSYHKKDGDKYGFQHHTAFGQENKDGKDADEHSGNYEYDEEAQDNGSVAEGNNAKLQEQEANEEEDEDDQGEETKNRNTYKVVEDVNEDYDDGAGSLGNYNEEVADGHYTQGATDEEEEDAGDGAAGHYTEGDDGDYTEGSSGHYTDGSSADASEDEDGDAESEHYEANEEDDDY